MPKGQCRWLWLSLILLLADLAVKKLAVMYLAYGVSTNIFPCFNLTLVYNSGSAFGFMQNFGGLQRWILSGIAILISLLLIVWLKRLPKKENITACALSLIIAGAWGNMLDRLIFGYVTDFIDLYYKTWHWPAFNLADTFICVGVIVLMFAKVGKG